MSQDSLQAATIHVTDQPACAQAEHEVIQSGMARDAKVCAVVVHCYLAKEGVLAEGDEALLLCGCPQHSAIIRTSCGFYASFIRLTLCPGLQVTHFRLEGHRQTPGSDSAITCSACKSQLDMQAHTQTYMMQMNECWFEFGGSDSDITAVDCSKNLQESWWASPSIGPRALSPS
jgi:hypothetical protein